MLFPTPCPPAPSSAIRSASPPRLTKLRLPPPAARQNPLFPRKIRHLPPRTHKIAHPSLISANLVTPRPARPFVVHIYPVPARMPRARADQSPKRDCGVLS
jgi:hypothetical protein